MALVSWSAAAVILTSSCAYVNMSGPTLDTGMRSGVEVVICHCWPRGMTHASRTGRGGPDRRSPRGDAHRRPAGGRAGRRGRRQRARAAARRQGRSRGRRRRRAVRRPRRRRGDRGGHLGACRAGAPRARRGDPGVLREAARRRRPRDPRGARARQRRGRFAVHRHLGRDLPRLFHPRLRQPPVRDRTRGGQRVRGRRQQGRRLLRLGGRRRHRHGHPAAGRRHGRDRPRRPLQRRGLRRALRGARQPRHDRGGPGRAGATALGGAGGRLARRQALRELLRALPGGLRHRAGRLRRPRARQDPEPVPSRGRARSALRRRGGRALAGRAPPRPSGRGPLMGAALLDRVAGAPISWGVCEVPDWGYQLPPDRVLGEMRELGLAATELGPDGFLPGDPPAWAGVLDAYGLHAVGGFVPLVLHDPGRDVAGTVAPVLDAFSAAGASTLVLAAATGLDGYDGRVHLDDDQWRVLLANLDRVHDTATERGITATLHPHVGTIVEGPQEVARVLEGSSIALCLDTGHLIVGGSHPARLAAAVPERIGHVHLKDVDAWLAAQIRSGTLTYTEAVKAGLYRPLGTGDVDVAAIVRVLESAGYQGWYVMEQDTVLDHEPAPGKGPSAAVRASLTFLRELAP